MTLAIGVAGGCPSFLAVLLSCDVNLERLEPMAMVVGLLGGGVTIVGLLIALWRRYS